MEVSSSSRRVIGRGRGRPAQALYMPPARRHRDPVVTNCEEVCSEFKLVQDEASDTKIMDDSIIVEKLVDLTIADDSIKDITSQCVQAPTSEFQGTPTSLVFVKDLPMKKEQETIKLITISEVFQMENNKPTHVKEIVQNDDTSAAKKEVKMKTRNTKVMDVKCDVLQISLVKNVKKSPIKLVQVDQWEDLINSDDEPSSPNSMVQKSKTVISPKYGDNDTEDHEDLKNDQLEHIVEIYDFPSTFKTQDIMQIYNEMDQESIYIKWLNDTRALLVLGSAIQAKRALGIENPFIKSRPAAMGSQLALDAVRTSNLRPAMKRPQTSMQTARRMITTALGAKSNVSREVQQRERDALRKAKEERRTQRQNERDAWEGNPRPTTV